MKIKRLTYFDRTKSKNLVPYLSQYENCNKYQTLLSEPLNFLNSILPAKIKFRPESYALVDDKNNITGILTIEKIKGNSQRFEITELYIRENQYDNAKKLIKFVIKKYGKSGASSFCTKIDTCHDEMFNLFINGCGFRSCSSETLWKNDKPTPNKTPSHLRFAQNSDSEQIAQLFNDEISSIYKPSLLRNPKEFQQPLFDGFNDFYKTRYVIDENNKIIGYFSVTTTDNTNYIIDITTNSGYELEYNKIINELLCNIAQRRKAFYPIIKQKLYTKEAEKLEAYLKSMNFTPIQTQAILIKDYYKPIKEPSAEINVVLLGENSITNN